MNKQQRDLLAKQAARIHRGTAAGAVTGQWLDEMSEALEAAAALFDKLPKDAHNNTVIPGTPTPLFNPKYHGTKWFATSAEWIEQDSDTGSWCVASTPVSEWYLDEKAAEAAHHLANGPHDHDHLEGK
jgi:hypothetical protein